MPLSSVSVSDAQDSLSLILRGGGSAAERFAWAWKRRPPALRSRAKLARDLGIHPSTLSPSNFKMTAAIQARVERMLGVAPGFLATKPPAEAGQPAVWQRLQACIATVREVCTSTHGQRSLTWSTAQAVLHCDRAAVLARLDGTVPAAWVELILAGLRSEARDQLDREVTITVTLGELTLAIEALVEASLSAEAGALRGECLRQARKWHRAARHIETKW